MATLPKEKAISRVEKRIVDIADADPWLKILVYGLNGKGKTRFAATAPKPIFVDINERGTKSARRTPNAKVFSAKKWDDITYLYWYLREGNHDRKTVILDTLTMMQHMCAKHVLKEAEDRDPNRDPKMMSQREWGKLAELMKPMLLDFRNLDMHVIFLCQERSVGDEDSEVIMKVPDLSPGSRAMATACVDIIGRIYTQEVRVVNKKTKKETKKTETRMLVGPHDEYITKDRTGSLGRIVRNPTVPMFIEAAKSMEEE